MQSETRKCHANAQTTTKQWSRQHRGRMIVAPPNLQTSRPVVMVYAVVHQQDVTQSSTSGFFVATTMCGVLYLARKDHLVRLSIKTPPPSVSSPLLLAVSSLAAAQDQRAQKEPIQPVSLRAEHSAPLADKRETSVTLPTVITCRRSSTQDQT